MRVAILADGRSPITQGWLTTLISLDYQVHLLSTFPCTVELPLASQHLVPIAFSSLSRTSAGSGAAAPGGAGAIQARALLRRWLGVATFPGAVRRLRSTLKAFDIDLLHALRIPYEGMLAAETKPDVPLLVSVWGNDFTLHARGAPWMDWLTNRVVARAHGLHADCQRDIHLARARGLRDTVPTLVVPGSGGIDRTLFRSGVPELARLRPEVRARLKMLDEDGPVVLNPRGFRAYVRSDTFFLAIPQILRELPDTKFLAPAMLGEKPAEKWVKRLEIEDSVILLPHLTALEMAELCRRSQVMVSPSEHDGTPNTFLEAIACGSFPIVGDLESLREWVDDGVNGLLIDPQDPGALADAVLRALRDADLRARASAHNQALIDARAERGQVAGKLDEFYEVALRSGGSKKPDNGGMA